jgi:hypothetical protein
MANLARLFTRHYWEYPQTWYFMPIKWKRLKSALQWLCGHLVGHEPSKTEWGYGGGDKADCWCRWCNKFGQIPLEVAREQWQTLRKMELQGFFNEVRKCGIESPSQTSGKQK